MDISCFKQNGNTSPLFYQQREPSKWRCEHARVIQRVVISQDVEEMSLEILLRGHWIMVERDN